MIPFTQNNKIAIAAVAIFFVSFSAMLFLMDTGDSSPDYVKANVLEAAMTNGSHGGGHSGPYFSDTGEEAAAEEKSEESNFDLENMYRVIVNNLDKPLFVLHPEGKVKFLSEDFVEEYGHKLEDVAEGTFFSLIQGDDLPDFVTEYTSVIHSAKSKDGVGPYRFLNKDGTVSVHLVDLIPVVNDKGVVTEVIGCVKDITSKVEDFGTSLDKGIEGDESGDGESGEPGALEEHFSTKLFKRLLGVKQG